MKKYITIILLLSGFSLVGFAQSLERQVISSTGNFSTAANLQLSSTVGETMTETFISGSLILTQGFQQPDNKGNVGLEEEGVSLSYTLFPNPTSGKLFISLKSEKALVVSLRLITIDGKETGIGLSDLLIQGNMQTEMDLSNLAAGTYLVQLRDAQHALRQTFKVQKIN